MDDTNFLPQDLTECHTLLLAAFKQSVQLEQQVADAKGQAERQSAKSAQQVAELERVLDETSAKSAQQVAELERVLDETSATYQVLQQTHAATLEELACSNVGHSVDGESGSPRAKAKDTCLSWTRRPPLSRPSPPRQRRKPTPKSKAISVARNARLIGINCGKFAMSTTCRMKKSYARAVTARWIASARTSRGNWNLSRPS